jgi:hypothetical protein
MHVMCSLSAKERLRLLPFLAAKFLAIAVTGIERS